jgi:dipeptidyl-peptidase-4
MIMLRTVLFSFLTLTSVVHAQEKLTLEKWLLDGEFRQESVYNINWMNDGQFYSALDENNIIKYDITTGQPVETIVEGNALGLPAPIDDYSFSSDEKKLLIQTNKEYIYRRSFTAEYFVYDLENQSITQLSDGGAQSYATFSPDASKVAFVRDNNLFYLVLKDMQEIQVTNDGKFNEIINGSTDWVYEEELYLTKAFNWSPEGDKLAFYRFDETEVKEYNMQVWNQGELYPTDYRYKYPKAGEVNSVVEIFVYHLDKNEKVKMDIGAETDIYIPKIIWTPDNSVLSIRRLNRLQNKLDVLHADATSGETTLVFTEQSATYIESYYEENLIYLKDKEGIVFTSDRDGYNHLYLYNWDGELVRQVTEGKWEITQFLGVDQSAKKPQAYFLSTEGSPMERQLFKVDLRGKKKERLTTGKGYHSINMSTDFSYYIF